MKFDYFQNKIKKNMYMSFEWVLLSKCSRIGNRECNAKTVTQQCNSLKMILLFFGQKETANLQLLTRHWGVKGKDCGDLCRRHEHTWIHQSFLHGQQWGWTLMFCSWTTCYTEKSQCFHLETAPDRALSLWPSQAWGLKRGKGCDFASQLEMNQYSVQSWWWVW